MGNHKVLSKCDQALVAYIISQGAGTVADVYTAKSSVDKELNDTIVWSERGVEDPPYSGNYTVTTRVQVRSVAAVDVNEDPDAVKQSSDDRVSDTFDLFHAATLGQNAGDKLAEAITAAGNIPDFTIQNVRVISVSQGYADQHGRVMKAPAWVDEMELEIICCPSSLGA